MMGLRLGEGVTRAAFRAETGDDFERSLNAAQLASLSNADFIALDETGLRATAAGRQRLNAVLGALLA
jgi:coproporphyrinogen III oxidase-like Fe-S oxidoreductase